MGFMQVCQFSPNWDSRSSSRACPGSVTAWALELQRVKKKPKSPYGDHFVTVKRQRTTASNPSQTYSSWSLYCFELPEKMTRRKDAKHVLSSAEGHPEFGEPDTPALQYSNNAIIQIHRLGVFFFFSVCRLGTPFSFSIAGYFVTVMQNYMNFAREMVISTAYALRG
jgi:hypothetical protein